MKKFAILLLLGTCLAACGGNSEKNTATSETSSTGSKAENGNPSYDPERGEGKFKEVAVAATVDQAMADAGGKIYSVKCNACHKLTGEKLVGPGWLGVT